ncbi:hypothetical protein ACET3X_000227 [Alternaria dauci]|uniref:Uncharacterized protein n=1 Tax=Alternaria dauci TaxID=48095 RepID=A0ABR3UUA7_9PLEO
MGVLSETRGPNGIIVAQPDHPIVQTFYDSRPSPQAMTGNIMDTERKRRSVFITLAEGSSFVPNVQSQQPLPPPKRQRSLPKTTVINSLDPRLQGRGTTMFSVKQEDIQPDIATNYNDMTTNDPQDTEDKLQEQEIEILKLRMDVVVKTREIRKLKAENDALKVENRNLRMHPVSTGVSFETGDNKPPWL